MGGAKHPWGAVRGAESRGASALYSFLQHTDTENPPDNFSKIQKERRCVNVTINYAPTPKQQMFHATPANEVLYGGAAGGGGSVGVIQANRSIYISHKKTPFFVSEFFRFRL